MSLLFALIAGTLTLELRRVQVVVRHGVRTTLNPFPAETEDWVCDGIGTVAFSTLRSKSVERVNHFLATYNSPHPTLKGGSCIQGILTTEGRLQHEQLGASVRERYRSFLPPAFDQRDFFIRSTNFERTKQSAMSFFMGMYQELKRDGNDIMPPPVMPVIHIAETDDWLLPSECPSTKDAVKYFVRDPDYVSLLASHADSQKRLSVLAGFDKIVGWGTLRDNLAARTAMNIALMPGFTEADVEESRLMHDTKYRLLYCRADIAERKRYLRPLIGRFIELLTKHMLNEKRPERFFFYSAHDTTVAPLMGALADPAKYECGQPAYASALIFELYGHNDQQYMRVLYNGDSFSPAFCTPTEVEGVDNLCSLEDYISGISEFYSKDFQEECYDTEWPSTK